MHKEILSDEQMKLIPLVNSFGKSFYLVGGTAIALHLGHRRSIDFDLFKNGSINPTQIVNKLKTYKVKYRITRRIEEQLNLIIDGVKFTFFNFPFNVETQKNNFTVPIPSLLNLAAMKAYALGHRSKWKDYVDLFFILKTKFSIPEISERATFIFGDLFSEKLFRAQLSFFDDVDYNEEIEWIGKPVSEEKIKNELIHLAVSF